MMMSKDNIDFINKCITQWKGEFSIDERLENFSKKFDEWIMQIPEESREIVKTLIINMTYYSNETANKWLKNLHEELLKYDNVTDNNTIYAFIKSKDGLSNSSNDYWTNYKALNRINSNLCVENLDAIDEEQWIYINNIVFVDDFSGSGCSLIKELKKRPKIYSGKTIYFIALNIMDLAISNIENFANSYNIKICFLVSKKQLKAFDRNMFENNLDAKKNIINMSKKLDIYPEFILGYEKSESLVAFYNNTPNNTLGFIWCDTDEGYHSIFPRKNEPKPPWQQIKNRRERKITNYNNRIRGSNND